MANTVYDVTTWTGATVSAYYDIGAVINQIIADIKANQTTQTTRPGAVVYIPPGHYDLRTRAVIDISFLQIKGAGHGFFSNAIRDDAGSQTGSWLETQPGGSHIRVVNTDGNHEAFLVQRTGTPRLSSIVFQDFCLDGVSSSKPYTGSNGNAKTGISVQSDNDALRIEGMGFVYLEHAISVNGADALGITNNYIAECGNSIELTGASQSVKISNNYLVSSWGGYSVRAEHAEGINITGNTVLWACNITLENSTRSTISANKLLSNFPSMISLKSSSESLIASNHFRRKYGDGTSTLRDDLYGLVHIEGSNNAVTGNFFSFDPDAPITPSGATPTAILVKSGDSNYLATNVLVRGTLPIQVVLDASTTNTKVIYSARTGQLTAYPPATHDFIATP
ncbi:NosD domain-containing protein [Kitasatospora sp. NPDC051914]|uniref:NosD domain-containing protein n=1 Tax=Kitasatospora sp. NPDC051914 TaxID=3154945 RepID=UPI003417BE43